MEKEREMKKLFLLVSILLIMPSSQAFAWKSICDVGEKTLYQTGVEFQKYFTEDIQDELLAVNGKVRNVYPKSNTTLRYSVLLDCGNDVIVVVGTGSSSVESLKIGQEAKFSCRFNKYERNYYRNSDKIYVKFWCIE